MNDSFIYTFNWSKSIAYVPLDLFFLEFTLLAVFDSGDRMRLFCIVGVVDDSTVAADVDDGIVAVVDDFGVLLALGTIINSFLPLFKLFDLSVGVMPVICVDSICILCVSVHVCVLVWMYGDK